MKRGASGLSLLLAVDKPVDLTSHDVVNRCRGIFQEKRIGHGGTLDPLASGVLPLGVGSAARLSRYLSEGDKAYRVRICFGAASDTDDREGRLIASGRPGAELSDEEFIRQYLRGLLGPQRQMPPVYSAIKVQGQKSYEAARKGNIIALQARDIEVFQADLVDFGPCEINLLTEDKSPWQSAGVYWDVDFRVSKGAYIRSLARDCGASLHCPAHVGALRRTAACGIGLEDCVSLEALESLKTRAALDPVRLLGYRFAFGDSKEKELCNGAALSVADLKIYEFLPERSSYLSCQCTPALCESERPLAFGEAVSLLLENRLKAIYRFDEAHNRIVPECVFSQGVIRGSID